MKKGEILEKEGLRILRLEGSPYEMGYQHGKALSKEIRWLHSNLKHLFAHYEGILGKFAFPIFRFASKILEKNIPKEFREEMRGISEGAEVDYNSVRLMSLTEELGKVFYSYLKPFIPFKCSCFVVKNGEEIIWGRNLDYLFYETLPVLNILFVFFPQKGMPFISVGWPGIIGVPTGMRRDLSLILLSSSTKSRVFKGVPQEALTRQVIQYSQNLEDGIKEILSLPATVGQNLVLVSKNDAKVIEVSPTKKAVRSLNSNGYLAVTNHFQIKEMEGEQVPPNPPRKASIPDELLSLFFTLEGSKKRAEKMKMALQNNHIDIKKAMEILDSVSGPGTVQSVVCIPQKEEFWVAKRGQPPVTKGEWIHFQIDDLL